MDRAEIFNTARQADIEVAHMSNGKIRTDAEIREQWVICFATMIEASVKEKAAKVCEEQKQEWNASVYRNGAIAAIGGCAAAIRSMK